MTPEAEADARGHQAVTATMREAARDVIAAAENLEDVIRERVGDEDVRIRAVAKVREAVGTAFQGLVGPSSDP